MTKRQRHIAREVGLTLLLFAMVGFCAYLAAVQMVAAG